MSDHVTTIDSFYMCHLTVELESGFRERERKHKKRKKEKKKGLGEQIMIDWTQLLLDPLPHTNFALVNASTTFGIRLIFFHLPSNASLCHQNDIMMPLFVINMTSLRVTPFFHWKV